MIRCLWLAVLLACGAEVDRTLPYESQCQSNMFNSHVYSTRYSVQTHEICGLQCFVDDSDGRHLYWLWYDC